MRTQKQKILLLIALIFNGLSFSTYAEITLEVAEQIALERDPVIQANQAKADAFREQAVSANTLPDPRFKLGLMNFPTDTYKRDQEPMTQIQVGIEQMIPRGDTLEIKSRQAIKSGEAADAMVENRRRMIRMNVRTAYLELVYWMHAEQVVNRSNILFNKLVDITQSQYASGQQRQQNVIRAELELGMLADRLDEIKSKQDATRAKLAKLIGSENAGKRITGSLPGLTSVPTEAMQLERLHQHPLIKGEDAKVAGSQYGIELARQGYKPDWMVGLNYGFRDGNNPNGTERPDFVSAMLSFDLPLFTGDRQNKNVAASRLRHQASLQAREDQVRELQRELSETLSDWRKLGDRLQRYDKTILPQAHENAKAALFAYQNRQGEFTALMRARIMELETELKHLRLRINHLKSHAKLLYLLGEEQ